MRIATSLFLTSCIVVAALVWFARHEYNKSLGNKGLEVANISQIREIPVRLASDIDFTLVSVAEPLTDRLSLLWSRIASISPMTPTDSDHFLRFFGGAADSPWGSHRVNLLSNLLNEDEATQKFDTQLHVINRFGFAFAHTDLGQHNSGEPHRDAFLATFGEVGLPASTSVYLHDNRRSLKDCISSSMANLSPIQDVEFGATALARYLEPWSVIQNKHHQIITLDELCLPLCSRPFGEGFCHGLHTEYSVASLINIHGRSPFLQTHTVDMLLTRATRFSTILQESQQPRGLWGKGWFQPNSSDFEDRTINLVVTSHILEAQAQLPRDCRLEMDRLLFAAESLVDTMLLMSDRELEMDRIPCTHCAVALRLIFPQGWRVFLSKDTPEL